jgi:transcriptional regulator with XRE-family HTH domain
MVRATSGNGDKSDRDELRRSMQASGHTTEQIANEMMRLWGYRPRAAWRHAHGWGQTEVAARYNQVLGDSSAPMTNRRISDYENWPFGGVKPTLNTLSLLAQVYGTSVANLVSMDDRKAFTTAECAALNGISTPSTVELARKVSSVPDNFSAATAQQSLSWTNAILQQSPVWSIKDLVDSVADETRSHAEITQGYLMSTSAIDDLTADVFALGRDRDNTTLLTAFSETVRL